MTTRPIAVVGVTEIAQALGVTKQRAHQLVARPDFPAPAAKLAQGSIWRTSDARRWVKLHRPDHANRLETP